MNSRFNNLTDTPLLQSQFPFTKIEIDLTTEDFTNKQFNVAGNNLIISNRFIPRGGTAVAPVNPSIRFSSIQSPEIEISPFAVYSLPFSKIFLTSEKIEDNVANPHNINSTLVLWSTNLRNIPVVNNFRNMDNFYIGNNQAIALNSGIQIFEVPVPIGVKKCDVDVSFSGIAGGTPSITIQGYCRLGFAETLYTNAFTGSEINTIDCGGYLSVRLIVNSGGGITGNVNWLMEFYD